MNLSFGIPVTIAYVAVDRTEDYGSPEERTYGIVTADYTHKSAFVQLQDMMNRLTAMTFKERLPSDTADYVFLFTSGSKKLLAAWTSSEAHDAAIDGGTVRLTSRSVYF